jgi:transposase
MLKRLSNNRKQIELVSIEDLVPQEHLVRKIDKAIDFNFIYDEVKDLYDVKGKPSIDPVALIKIALIQYMFGIRSMRQTIKELEVNMAYRWFCGFGITDNIPHFSTFGKNYTRRFADTDVFEKIFARILNIAITNGFVNCKAAYIDSTHIKASANKKKKREYFVKKETRDYHDKLFEEINEDRKENDKKELIDKDDDGEIKITKSTTDPDAGEFHKGEHEKQFAYSAHVACDKNAFVLDFTVTPANKHDSTEFSPLFKRIKNKFNPKYIGLDAGYKTPAIAKEIIDSNSIPLFPYTRQKKHEKDMFYKKAFKYDPYYNCYICPCNERLEYSTTNRLGYREFKSDSGVCKNCPNLGKCTNSKNNTKLITRHLWQEYLDKAEEIRLSPKGKALYAKRSQTIERIFGDAKEKHGMRYTQLRGLKKVTLQVLLTFLCMNMKKVATWMERGTDKTIKKVQELLKNMKNLIFLLNLQVKKTY